MKFVKYLLAAFGLFVSSGLSAAASAQFGGTDGSLLFDWPYDYMRDEDEIFNIITLKCMGRYTKGITFSSDGKYLIFANCENAIKVLDLSDKDGIRFFLGGCMFSPGGIQGIKSFKGGRFDLIAIDANNFIAAECYRGSVRLWNFKNDKHELLYDGDRDISAVAFKQDGSVLAVGYKNGTVRLWDVPQKVLVNEFNCNKCVDAMAFSNRGDILAIGTCKRQGETYGFIELWDIESMRCLKSIPCDISTKTLKFSADDKCLIYISFNDFTLSSDIAFYNLENAKCERAAGFYFRLTHRVFWEDLGSLWHGDVLSVNDIAISPDGLCVAIGRPGDGEIMLFFDANALRAWRECNFSVRPWVDVFNLQRR